MERIVVATILIIALVFGWWFIISRFIVGREPEASSNISVWYDGERLPVKQDGNTYWITLPKIQGSDNVTFEILYKE